MKCCSQGSPRSKTVPLHTREHGNELWQGLPVYNWLVGVTVESQDLGGVAGGAVCNTYKEERARNLASLVGLYGYRILGAVCMFSDERGMKCDILLRFQRLMQSAFFFPCTFTRQQNYLLCCENFCFTSSGGCPTLHSLYTEIGRGRAMNGSRVH